MPDNHVDKIHPLPLDRTPIPDDAVLTGTGLDFLLTTVARDQGLQFRLDDADIATAIAAASEMNDLIVQAIRATGVANDGDLRPADAYALSDWIGANALGRWTAAHGDDENGIETGFHLTQNDGGQSFLFGEQAVNTVADGIYHLGFGYTRDRLVNEDGNANARLEDVAFWLSALLADDLTNGSLTNAQVDPEPAGTSGTGLDQIVRIALDDPGLTRRLPLHEIAAGAAAADGMNQIVRDSIVALGIANDGTLSASDVYGLADHISANHRQQWAMLHGDDERGVETGFHLVQNDGALTHLFGNNAVNTVADGIYHLGFGYRGGSLIDEDGNANARVEEVALWLNELMADDLADGSLVNTAVEPIPGGMTMTGLDDIVEIIATDPGLARRVPLGELADAVAAADAMNTIILDGIDALGLANDGELRVSETFALAEWINTYRLAEWTLHHGDDENGLETRFHLVQNDGALTRTFGENAVDTVADGIYHLGFGHNGKRLINEDGNPNARVEDVAYWLNEYLAADLAALSNAAAPDLPRGATGTGLDKLVDIVLDDAELNRRLPLDDIVGGAEAAVEMNKIVLAGIKATGIADDGGLTAGDVRLLADWITTNHHTAWLTHHGDDEQGVETGFHLVQNDGAKSRLFSKNAVDTVADGLYHLGFGYSGNNVINEDGNRNAELTDIAHWLEELLAEDLADGSLTGTGALTVQGSTGTGLDAIVDAIMADPALSRQYKTTEAAEAAQAADQLNALLIDAVTATGAANDGAISEADVREIDAYIAANLQPAWDAQLGDDDIAATGVRSVLGWVAVEQLLGQNAVQDLARGIYALGHGFKWDRIVDNEGDATERAEDVARWLDTLLRDQLRDGSLLNPALLPVDPAAISGNLIAATENPVTTASGPSVIAHTQSMEVSTGAIAVTLTPDDLDRGRITFFSKDAAGFQNGGHATGYIEGGRFVVRLQDATDSYFLYSPYGELTAGTSYDVVVNFGPGGAELWLNGEMVDRDPAAVIDWRSNDNPLVIGAGITGSSAGAADRIDTPFLGEIATARVYDRTLTKSEILGLNVSGPLGVHGVGDPAISTASAPNVLPSGTGLTAEVWDMPGNFSSIEDVVDLHESSAAPTHTVAVDKIAFGGGADSQTLQGFLNGNGTVTSGDAAVTMDGVGMRLHGYVYIPEGEHLITVRSDDGMLLRIGGEEVVSYRYGRSAEPSTALVDLDGGLYEIELFYFENGGGQSLGFEIDGRTVPRSDLFPSVAAFENGVPGPVDPGPGMTGTGLDAIIEWISTDPGLRDRISAEDIENGARAAAEMNKIILNAIYLTGVGADGEISAGDTYDIADWINANAYAAWTHFHGDDESGIETGFHLVQNDGDALYRFGEAAIDTVADGIYHLGFGYRGNRLINEDGNDNQRVEEVAYWLDSLLAEDLARSAVWSTHASDLPPGTGTGLDQLVDLAANDPELQRRLPGSELSEGLDAAHRMNQLILNAIYVTGTGNDGHVTAADVTDLSDWLQIHHKAAWAHFHGDDESGIETGFHLIQGDGAITRLYGENAVDTVADGLYHIGFGYKDGKLIDEDGNRNAALEDVAFYLNELLADDFAAGRLTNPNARAYWTGTTGTGLDDFVDIIVNDPELQRRVDISDINVGAYSADKMNHIIVEAIGRLGYANDGRISNAEVRGLADDIRANSYAEWLVWHGDDEHGFETNFHRVQNDGAVTRLYSENAVNTVIDAVYHLGFGYKGGRLINEDGNANERIADVAYWLDRTLADDLADGTLANPQVRSLPVGSTGTGLDQLVAAITGDPGLEENISIRDIANGAWFADNMNKIIVEGVVATGIATNGRITAADVRVLSDWIAGNRHAEWLRLHGDDEKALETGFHLVQNDGATDRMFGENAVNTVIDGIYHLGFGYRGDRLIDEDGNSNQRLVDVAYWLEAVLADDLAASAFGGPARYVTGVSGTGLDLIVDMITNDAALNRDSDTYTIANAAWNALRMNSLIAEGIRTLDLARDAKITAVDVADLSDWLVSNFGTAWAGLHGRNGSGFDAADQEGGSSTLFDHLGIDQVADAIYHLGFGIRPNWAGSWVDGHTIDQNGRTDYSVDQVAEWLDLLLADDLASARLVRGAPASAPPNTLLVLYKPDALAIEDRDDVVEVFHTGSFALTEGTIALDFTAGDLSGWRTLFSRDYSGFEAGGHITIRIENGELVARLQDTGESYYLRSGDVRILPGEDYSLALTFGVDGAGLFLNGEKLDTAPDIAVDWTALYKSILIGASGAHRSVNRPDDVRDIFDGQISNVRIYKEALSTGKIAALNTSGDLPASPVGAPLIASDDLPETLPSGDGLLGEVFAFAAGIGDVQTVADAAAVAAPAATFGATSIDFAAASETPSLAAFLGQNGSPLTGDPATPIDNVGIRLAGYVYLEQGEHEVKVTSDDGFRLRLGGEVTAEFPGQRGALPSEFVIDVEGGLYAVEVLYFDNRGDEVLGLEIDGKVAGPERLFSSSQIEGLVDAQMATAGQDSLMFVADPMMGA